MTNFVVEAFEFFRNNHSNLTPEQWKHIRNMANAYQDMENELTDKISRRNIQIKELRARIKELEAFNQTFGDKRE